MPAGRSTIQCARNCAAVVLLAGHVSIVSADCPSQYNFLPQIVLPVSGETSVAVDDFNADGIQDLAYLMLGNDPTPPTLRIRLGAGTQGQWNGTFLPESVYVIGSNSYGLVVRDFNHDGIRDLAFGDGGTIQIMLGGGIASTWDGTFTTQAVTAGGAPQIGDFNGDGILDIAFLSSGQLCLRYGLGTNGSWDGGFTAPLCRITGPS